MESLGLGQSSKIMDSKESRLDPWSMVLPPVPAVAKQGLVLVLGWISKQREAAGHGVMAKGEKEFKHLLGAAGNSTLSCSPPINPIKSNEAGQDLCPEWGKPARIKTEPQKS